MNPCTRWKTLLVSTKSKHSCTLSTVLQARERLHKENDKKETTTVRLVSLLWTVWHYRYLSVNSENSLMSWGPSNVTIISVTIRVLLPLYEVSVSHVLGWLYLGYFCFLVTNIVRYLNHRLGTPVNKLFWKFKFEFRRNLLLYFTVNVILLKRSNVRLTETNAVTSWWTRLFSRCKYF